MAADDEEIFCPLDLSGQKNLSLQDFFDPIAGLKKSSTRGGGLGFEFRYDAKASIGIIRKLGVISSTEPNRPMGVIGIRPASRGANKTKNRLRLSADVCGKKLICPAIVIAGHFLSM